MLAEVTLLGAPPWVGLLALVVAAALAGIINAMAGGGSLLIVPVLLGLGLPPGVANGTLRVGVAVQSIASAATFYRRGFRDTGPLKRLVLPVVLGGAAGTALATRLPDDVLRVVFGVMLAGWAVVLVLRPSRFLQPREPARQVGLVAMGLGAAVGVYGGFLQAGVGFPMLALLVLYLGHGPVAANATKVLLTLAYTMVSLPMFAFAGQVAWREGAALAVGGVLGGWLGAHLQIRAGAGLVRWVVVVTVGVSGVVMLGRALA